MNDKNEKFLKGLIQNGKFIGFDIIANKPQLGINDELCQQLITKLKKEQTSKKEHKQKIQIKLNLDCIEIVDEKSGNPLFIKHQIDRILFISIDRSDTRSIGYVYKNDENSFIYFALKTERPAQELFLLLRELFELLKEKAEKKNLSRAQSLASISTSASLDSSQQNEPQEYIIIINCLS